MQTYPCIGWIPCVSGDLVYDLVSTGYTGIERADSVCIYSPGNQPDGSRQEQVIYTSLIDNNDFSVKECLPEHSKYSRVIFFLEKDCHTGLLKGHFFLISSKPAVNDGEFNRLYKSTTGFYDFYHSSILDEIEALSNQVDDSSYNSISEYNAFVQNRKCKPVLDLSGLKKLLHIDQLSAGVTTKFSHSNSEPGSIKMFSCVHAEIQVKRNGIWYASLPKRYIVSSAGIGLPNNEMDTLSAQQFSEEIFIRVKNVFHKHNHHSHQDDDVLSATCIEEGSSHEENKENEAKALKRILRNLKRSIAHERRDLVDNCSTSIESSKVIGLCEYGKSYIHILKRANASKMFEDEWLAAEIAFFDNTIGSVNAHMLGNKGFFPIQKHIQFVPYQNALLVLLPILTVVWLSINIFFGGAAFNLTEALGLKSNFFTQYLGQIGVLLVAFIFVTEIRTYYRFGVKNGLIYYIASLFMKVVGSAANFIALDHTVRLTNATNITFLNRLRLTTFIVLDSIRSISVYEDTRSKVKNYATALWAVIFVVSLILLVNL